MRILWVSNAPWAATGYGNQTDLIVPRLQRLGHEVAVFAFYGLQGGMITVNGTKVYPSGLLHWGNDLIRPHAKAFGAQLVVSFMDVWVQEYWGKRLAEEKILFAPWTPVDQSPVPDLVVEKLSGATAVLAMSEFGARELAQAGVHPVTTIPCGVDMDVFRPVPQREARARLGLPDHRFIIGMVAKNTGVPSRKCFVEQLLAFSRFARKHSDAVLYLHTVTSAYDGGLDLEQLARQVGLRWGENVIGANQYRLLMGYTGMQMADVYNSLDVLSAASMAEGFGIPIVEAQACGTPVVTTACTSMPELTLGGWMVQRTHPFWTALGGWTAQPDVEELAQRYEEAYDARHDDTRWRALSQDALRVRSLYDIDALVRNDWRRWLETIDGATC